MSKRFLITTVSGGLVAGGVFAVGYLVKQNLVSQDSSSYSETTFANFIVVTQSTSESNQPSSEMFSSDEKKKQQFKCKLNGSSDVFDEDCVISSIIIPSDKHWIGKSSLFSIPENNDAPLAKTSFQTDNSFFKVKVSNDFWKKYYESTENDKKIELIPKNFTSGEESKKFASLTPLFSYKNGKETGNTNYFLAKTKNISTINLSSTASPKCSLISLDDASGKSSSNCFISAFASGDGAEQDLNSLVFSRNVSTPINADSIITEKYYLVKFTEDNNKKLDMSKINSRFVYAQVINNDSDTKIKNIKFDLITPVVFSPTNGSTMNAFLVR